MNAPRPRLAGETLQFMRRLWDLTHALDVRSKQMRRTIGVTGPQRLVIRVVGQAPGISARDLAASLGLHPSTLTGILARLEVQRIMSRVVDPADRRRVRLQLTPRGARIDRDRKGTVEAAVRRALAQADATVIAKTSTMLALLVAELSRVDG